MTKLFFKNKPIIGLDIDQTGIKLMSVDPKKLLVTGYGSLDLDPTKMQAVFDSDDDSYLTEQLGFLLKKNFTGHASSNHVVIGVPTGRTFTRTFSLPLSAEKDIKSAVDLEVDQYIPVPTETLYIDHQVIERTDSEIIVLMTAIPRRVIDTCVVAAQKNDLRPCLAESAASAAARLLELTEEGHLPTIIIDIGPATTDIAVLDKAIRLTSTLSIGGNTFTLDIARKLGVPLETAHQFKVLNGLSTGARQKKLTNSLSPSLDRIAAETRKIMRYYDERVSGHKKLEQVLIVGGGSNVPGIGDYFTNSLVMPARVASPWQRLNWGELQQPTKHLKPRFMTVAGLASADPEEILR